MQYRQFGMTPMKPSLLGFGCMRLPTRDGRAQSPDIDRIAFQKLARYALEHGINYFDTAYTYHEGQSERVLGEIFTVLPRKKVFLVTKMPTWAVNEPGDFDRYLEEQLSRLRTDYVDGYLLHNIKLPTYQKLCAMGVREWLEKQKERGRILFTGFSSHESGQAFQEVIDDWSGWDACQIQYNYMNEDVQAGSQGLSYAHKKGLAIIVMEPLLGGNLADPPQSVKNVFATSPVQRTPADWAFRWLWNRPEISTVLSGMNTQAQLEENLASVNRSAVESLTEEDRILYQKVQEVFRSLWPVPCTGCGYCLPCPSGVDIPRIFQLYNHAMVHGLFGLNQVIYQTVVPAESRGDQCQHCGHCTEHCPQNIAVPDQLSLVHRAFMKQSEG